MDDWEIIEKELLEDPGTRAAYERTRAAHDLADQIIGLRVRLGITQKELAQAAGVTQPEIARLESGHISPRFDTLAKVIGSVGATFTITPPRKTRARKKVAS